MAPDEDRARSRPGRQRRAACGSVNQKPSPRPGIGTTRTSHRRASPPPRGSRPTSVGRPRTPSRDPGAGPGSRRHAIARSVVGAAPRARPRACPPTPDSSWPRAVGTSAVVPVSASASSTVTGCPSRGNSIGRERPPRRQRLDGRSTPRSNTSRAPTAAAASSSTMAAAAARSGRSATAPARATAWPRCRRARASRGPRRARARRESPAQRRARARRRPTGRSTSRSCRPLRLELCPEARHRAGQSGLDGSRRDVERVGHLGLGQIEQPPVRGRRGGPRRGARSSPARASPRPRASTRVPQDDQHRRGGRRRAERGRCADPRRATDSWPSWRRCGRATGGTARPDGTGGGRTRPSRTPPGPCRQDRPMARRPGRRGSPARGSARPARRRPRRLRPGRPRQRLVGPARPCVVVESTAPLYTGRPGEVPVGALHGVPVTTLAAGLPRGPRSKEPWRLVLRRATIAVRGRRPAGHRPFEPRSPLGS